MENQCITARDAKNATAHGTDMVSLTTRKMLDDAQQKFHENRMGTTKIQSVKQAANGYEVLLENNGHHSTVAVGSDDVGSATALAVVGPDIYEHMKDARAFGNRALLTGGAILGAAQAGGREWVTDPCKAVAETAANVVTVGGLIVGSEAAPHLTGTVGAALLGWGAAQLYHVYPEFANRANTVKNFYDQAGQTDSATILKQSGQTGELIGPDLYHAGSTILGVVLGGRMGAGLSAGTGNLEAGVAQSLKSGSQSLVDTMTEAQATLAKALTPQQARLAFVSAMSGIDVPLENTYESGVLKSVGRASEGAEQSVELPPKPRTFVNQIDEAALKQYREAKTPDALFPGDEGWKRTAGGWVRNTRASQLGSTHKIHESFAAGSHYSIAYEGPVENTLITYDFRSGQEITNILPVEDYNAIYESFNVGEGKVYPKPNFVRPNPRK